MTQPKHNLRELRERVMRDSPPYIEIYTALGAAIDALEDAVAIHEEYLSQIGRCVSKDYARLNMFPIKCAHLGVGFKFPEEKADEIPE